MGSVSNLPTLNPVSKLPPSSPWTPSTLRSRFVSALSDMYRTEVPLYGNLVAIVGEVDAKVLAARGEEPSSLPVRNSVERHGAIRLEATAQLERWKQEGKKKELNEALATTFRAYPDDWDQLRTQGLVYFRYKVAKESASKSGAVQEGLAAGQLVDMEALLRAGAVVCEPITYEDFLPLSAAGIFTSNLSLGGPNEATERKLEKMEEQSNASRAELEQLLGCVIPSEIDLYDELQAASVKACEEALGLSKIVLAA
ncbi:hypothetical protein CcaverHIS002_0400140 [Cutaneotrichosporon cavernicola]|nr:hypothetical protein CcaverHIS002_0400140 [Cutaneotrichosporon cavernicola]